VLTYTVHTIYTLETFWHLASSNQSPGRGDNNQSRYKGVAWYCTGVFTWVCPLIRTMSSSAWAVCSTLISKWWLMDSSLCTCSSSSVPCVNTTELWQLEKYLSHKLYYLHSVWIKNGPQNKLLLFNTISTVLSEILDIQTL